MKMPALIVLLFALLACGCVRIPNVRAAEYHRRTAVAGVVSTADLSGITRTETDQKVTVKAAEAKFGLSFPGFDHQQTLVDAEASYKKAKEGK